MAKQRYINTKFWEDQYISDLDPSEKLIFLYMLTNSATNICGVYEIPLKRISSDTGYDKEMVVKIINRFKADGKMIYIDGYIIIKNFIKHQALNPKVSRGIVAELSRLPDNIREYVDYDISPDCVPVKRKKLSPAVRMLILNKHDNKCVNCGETTSLEIDHILPLCLGGTDNEDNLQVLCQKCNGKKNADLQWSNEGRVEGSLSHLNSNTNLNANSNHNPENDALPVPVVNKLDHNHLAYKAAKYLFDSIVNNSNPTKWIKNPPNLNNWAIDIDKLNRIDGIDYDKIKDVIDFCTSHKFWKSNILSASCLREKFTKLEAQMPKATQKAQRELNFVDNAFEEAKIRNMTIDELISLDPHIRSVLAGKDLTEYRKKYRM